MKKIFLLFLTALLTLLSVGLLIMGMCFAAGAFGYYGSNAPGYDTIGDSVNEEDLFMTDTVIERSEAPSTEPYVAPAPTPDSITAPAAQPTENISDHDDDPLPYDTTKYY